MKVCNKCNIEKEIIEFDKGRNQCRNQCRKCRKEHNKQYQKIYKENNPEKVKISSIRLNNYIYNHSVVK